MSFLLRKPSSLTSRENNTTDPNVSVKEGFAVEIMRRECSKLKMTILVQSP